MCLTNCSAETSRVASAEGHTHAVGLQIGVSGELFSKPRRGMWIKGGGTLHRSEFVISMCVSGGTVAQKTKSACSCRTWSTQKPDDEKIECESARRDRAG